MAHSDATPIVANLIPELAARLADEDESVTDLIAETNAFGWGLDGYDNLKAWFKGHGKVGFTVGITVSGDQRDGDYVFCGSEIKASVEGEATDEGNSWKITTYTVSEAKITDF